jgi:Flp pilus assembly protein TadG
MTNRGLAHPAGQALVETALVLPIILLIVIGLFDAGRAVFAYNAATNAAREGARLAIVNQDIAKVQQRVTTLAISAPIDSITVQFYRAGRDTTSSSDVDKCLGTPQSPLTIGCVAVVTFRTSFTAITPIVGSLIGPVTMSARAELPIEFVCPSPTIPNANSCPKQP